VRGLASFASVRAPVWSKLHWVLHQVNLYGCGLDVKRKDGNYARAKGIGCEPLAALIESFGGFSPELMGLLKRAAEQRMNRLTHYEYDQTTWAARSCGQRSRRKSSRVSGSLGNGHRPTELAVAPSASRPVVGDPRAA
jgi:hypothetical protein